MVHDVPVLWPGQITVREDLEAARYREVELMGCSGPSETAFCVAVNSIAYGGGGVWLNSGTETDGQSSRNF
jgi:hypothetical protein